MLIKSVDLKKSVRLIETPMGVNKLKSKVRECLSRTGRKLGCACYLSVIAAIGFVILIITALIIKFQILNIYTYTIYIDTEDGAPYITNERFLSLGLDSTVITDGFKGFNMTDPVLLKMIQHLSPAYLRVGGNQADQIIFTDFPIYNGQGYAPDNFILRGSDWLQLYHMSEKANVSIIYDLNSLLRYDNGSWNPDNGETMIQFSDMNNMQVNWELGNEPNSYPHKFNTSVNATQLGIDYITLRDILNKTELYKNSYLVGPSTTRLRDKNIEQYLTDFLTSGKQAVSAITWHHYYFSGENATSAEFLDPNVFNYLESHINKVMKIVKQLNIVDKPIWLGETSSAWHNGAPNLSDRFIGSFIWLDKLGLSAKMGINLVIRQSLFKGHYALIDDNYYPNPDWWISVAYNKFVSRRVITTKTEGDTKIRMYVHCAKSSTLWGDSAVVVFGVNISDKKGSVTIEELKSDKVMYAYEFTSANDLFSQHVLLNGRFLSLLPDYDLPNFEPTIVSWNKQVTMRPYSINFWILPNSNAKACENQ